MEYRQLLKNISLFREFPEELTDAFLKVCVPRKFSKKQMIVFRGKDRQKTFFIIEGEVKLYRSAEGRRVVIQVLKTGDFFGDLSFARHPYSIVSENSAQSETETLVGVIEPEELYKLIHSYPPFAMLLLVALRNRLHQAESKIKDLAASPAQTRLLNELIRHYVHHGKETEEFFEIEEKLTHQELAEMIGVTRETVTKTMSNLQRLGFLEYTPARLIRINKEKILNECPECLRLEQEEKGERVAS